MNESHYKTTSSKNRPPISMAEMLFLSFFGSGLLPKAPGTWGSLASLPILYFAGQLKAPFFLYLPFLLIMTVGACYITDVVQKKHHIHDPSWIVIDEVLGMITTWLFHPTGVWWELLIIFAYFRFFDIIKFWPASYFDQKVSHGAGTILDDIVSGIYAGLCVYLTMTFLIHKT